MAALNRESKIRVLLAWFKRRRDRRAIKKKIIKFPAKSSSYSTKKYHVAFINAVIMAINTPRIRSEWMHPRSNVWFDMVDNEYDDELWYVNFRVTRQTFDFVLNTVKDDLIHENTVMREAISAKRRLAITLYFVSSTAEYKTIGNLFGVSRSFVCMCIREVCSVITKGLSKFIKFPRGQQLWQVIDDYESRWGFPMCAGAIDGTHIPIIAPTESRTEYVNRKGFHSIIMQAVVDSNYLFRDVVVGWPGSVHDARVFSNSAIFRKGNEGKLFPSNFSREINGEDISPVILADPAYPLLSWLMKGFDAKGDLSRKERLFNYRLSRARMTVENTFGRWKGRFIRFGKRVDMEVQNVVTVVLASCILHNICESQNNNFLPQWQNEVAVPADDDVEDIQESEETDGLDIRAILADYFA
jgi:hypothetical protein